MRSLEPRRSVINRIPDGTMRDNTYALSSPRDVVSLFLSLEDAEHLGMVWTGSISQVAEDQNQTAVKNLRGQLKSDITRAFSVLPDATGPYSL